MSEAPPSVGKDFAHPRVFGIRVRPVTARRFANFRANRRARVALWLFLGVFLITLFADFIANDRPILVKYDGQFYVPVLATYPETTFGGEFETEAEYRDVYVRDLINAKGWQVWPLIPFSYRTINYELTQPAPSPPSAVNWLGTDDQARDVLARLIYGLRISILFGLTLTAIASVIGVAVGAVQGYFAGWTDLILQRVIEVWSGMPQLYLLIMMSSGIILPSVFGRPGFWTLLTILLLFEWISLVSVVRAEFLRARNLDYVRAARALGQPDRVIMWKHVLPNAVVATITFLPFNLTGGISLLTGLDFLGLGLPPGSASLGELVNQGKANLQAPWLGFTAFFSLAILLSLLVFIGEGLRDAFDPRKTTAAGAPAPAALPAADTKAQLP